MNKMGLVLKDSPVAWKYLNGLFCVYKPVDVSPRAVKAAILTNLCRSEYLPTVEVELITLVRASKARTVVLPMS